MSDLASALDGLSLAETAAETDSTIIVIDNLNDCATRIGAMIEKSEPIAIDFEGIDLCRHGELCLMQLASRTGAVLLVDITTLGKPAFDEGKLKELLESTSVLKLIYDGRADCDTTFHQFGVHPAYLYDIQVAYYTKRDQTSYRGRDRFVKGLKSALEDCPGLSYETRRELEETKTNGIARFAPEKGGSYAVWKERPMDPALMRYAAADVRFLHTMYDAWATFVPVEAMVEISSARVSKAILASMPAKGKHMALKDF